MSPPEYVFARRVLLDALDALGPHRQAVVLVGAQAVYQHCGSADFVTAPTTTDADLAVIPALLADLPLLGDAMRQRGFVPGSQPGIWLGRGGVAVDLMTPEALSGARGRRGARLPRHGNDVARRTVGLEAAVVDHDTRAVCALEDDDPRSFAIEVAGPAALLVSKATKIYERRDQPHRLKPKDGLDVLRLLRATDGAALARSLQVLVNDELAGAVTAAAVEALRAVTVGPDSLLPQLAAAAERGFDDPDVIAMSTVVLVAELLSEFDAAVVARP